MNQAHDDEIDLFELFEILWSGKWLIIGFAAFSLLLGSGFLALKDAEYESKIIIKTDNSPPFYDEDKILTDFEKLFYSPQTFGDWKKTGGDTSLIFENFSKTEIVDGFELSRDQDDLQVLIKSEKRSGHFFLIRSGQPEILDGFLDYSIYVNNLLNINNVMRARSELNLIEERSDNISLTGTDNIIQTLLSIDRFIASLENGGDVLIFENPTIPKKVSPKTTLVLALSVVLGGMVGAVLVLVRSAVTKRKNQLTKAM